MESSSGSDSAMEKLSSFEIGQLQARAGRAMVLEAERDDLRERVAELEEERDAAMHESDYQYRRAENAIVEQGKAIAIKDLWVKTAKKAEKERDQLRTDLAEFTRSSLRTGIHRARIQQLEEERDELRKIRSDLLVDIEEHRFARGLVTAYLRQEFELTEDDLPETQLIEWCNGLKCIVTDVEGKRYPCKRSIFEASHEPADNSVELRPEVAWFAQQMEKVLRANDHKGGWEADALEDLCCRAEEELDELHHALAVDDDATKVIKEAADVANFAMMIADNLRHGRGQGEDS